MKFPTVSNHFSGALNSKNKNLDNTIPGEASETNMKNLPKPIAELFSKLAKAQTFFERVYILEDSLQSIDGFQKVDDNEYAYQGYHLKLGFSTYLDPLAKKLSFLNQQKIESAPVVCAYRKFNAQDGLLMTSYSGCNYRDLVSYDEGKNNLTPDSKKRFLAEMKSLSQQGMVHSFVGRGTYYWNVDASNGKIVLKGWDYLEQRDKPSREAILEKVNSLLAL